MDRNRINSHCQTEVGVGGQREGVIVSEGAVIISVIVMEIEISVPLQPCHDVWICAVFLMMRKSAGGLIISAHQH